MGARKRFSLLIPLFNVAALCSLTVCRGQDVDGLVRDPQQLIGKPTVVVPKKGPVESGILTELFQPRDDPFAIVHFEIKSERGRTRRFKPDQIRAIRIAERPMSIFPHLPTLAFQLVDVAKANELIDERLNAMQCRRSSLYEQKDHDDLSRAARVDLVEAVKKLSIAKQVEITEGKHVILVTDYPARQRPGLVNFIDSFVPKLNELFGFQKDDLVLPGKPVIALFASRDNLGVFQDSVVGNPNYGTIRAFFHLIDGHVIVTAEDDRSAKHACWQVAWGLSGAYARFSYSTVVLPAWFRVGLQQHSADLLVPGLADNAQQRKRVIEEIKGGSLNGLLGADQLPLDRQIVCKLVVAHLYRLSPEACGQMLNLLKLARTTEEALSICYGMDERQLASSFGQTLGLPRLTP